jgi:hypothetical protein
MQTSSKFRRRSACPPHTPLMGNATEEGSYTVQCLACGLQGPPSDDLLNAKLAFDEAFAQPS